MALSELSSFPPKLAIGNRVWTVSGYQDHGPLEGPKIDIPPETGGNIISTEKPYMTMDHLLYVVRWDRGQVSKHYAKGLFCIGRFQTRTEFEAAIKPRGIIELTQGPRGGFRHAKVELEFDGHSQVALVYDRTLWSECVEPIVKQHHLEIVARQES